MYIINKSSNRNALALVQSKQADNDVEKGNIYKLDKLNVGESIYVKIDAYAPHMGIVLRNHVKRVNNKHDSKFTFSGDKDFYELCRWL